MTEVSCLSQHLFSPREGNLNSVYKIFRYLHKNLSNNPGRIAFDPDCVTKDDKVFEESTRDMEYWNEFYLGELEAHLRKKLEPLGESVTVWIYVDTNHAVNLANRRSHSSILIYVNYALIKLYIKRHNTVESSSFGLEFME